MIALASLLLSAATPVAQPAAAPAPTATLRVDPVVTQLPHISIVTAGRGSPVVLIPGLSSPRAVWDDVAADLARRHEVILVQVNGFGGDAPGANLVDGLLPGVVADLHAYAARRKLAGVPVVGHSMGGLLAMMWARAHPDDVGKAMIVDALPFVGALFAPDATVASVTPRGRVIRDAMAASYGQPANTAAAEATAAGLALTPDARAKVTRWVLAADPRVGAQAFYEDLTTDLRPDLPALKTPLTVVYPWAARGPSQPQAAGLYRGAYAGAPNATFVEVAESAHFIMLDQPAAFRTALAAFLAR